MNAPAPPPDGEPAADPLDEVLVAYLDGQLSAAESDALESRLAADDRARSRLQSLDRVWNALDALPRSTASAAFTRSTVEMAAVSSVAGDLAKPDAASRRSLPRLPRWTLVAAAGVAAGWLAVAMLVGLRDRGLLRDLPVAMQASALQQVQTFGFLQRFASEQPRLIEAVLSDELRQESRSWDEVTGMTMPERRQWLEGLPSAESADAADSVVAFRSLTEAKQASLREFVETVAASDQGDVYREAALAYRQITDRLSAARRSELRQMSDSERLAAIARYGRDLARDTALELTGSEREVFLRAVKRVVSGRALASRSDDNGRDRERGAEMVRRLRREDPQRVLMFVSMAVANGGPPSGRGRDQDRFAALFRERALAAWEAWSPELIATLPDRVQAFFDRSDDERNRARLMVRLLVMRPPKDLAESFVSDFDAEQVDRLLLLPTEEFRDAVAQGGAADEPPPFGGPGDRRFGGPPPPFGPRSGPPPPSGEGRERRGPPYARPPR